REDGRDELTRAETRRFLAAGQRKDEARADGTRGGPREDRARADFLPREATKCLTESVEMFVEQRLERLEGEVAGCDPSPAGKDDRIGLVALHHAAQEAHD